MNRVIIRIIAGLIFGAMSTAYAADVKHGDDRLTVGGSPVLTVATNGGLSGEIVSATATAVSNGTVTVYTTPATGEFVLTQMCVSLISTASTAGVLIGSSIGAIAHNEGSDTAGDGGCTQYVPGFLIPAGETITFRGNNLTAVRTIVSITGIYIAP